MAADPGCDMNEAISILFMLLGAHAICDFPLQGDFMAKAKNPVSPLPGVPWWIVMAAHSLIHGVAVASVTGRPDLGALEVFTHFCIDTGKCRGGYGFTTDQCLHVVCKGVWWMVWIGLHQGA